MLLSARQSATPVQPHAKLFWILGPFCATLRLRKAKGAPRANQSDPGSASILTQTVRSGRPEAETGVNQGHALGYTYT